MHEPDLCCNEKSQSPTPNDTTEYSPVAFQSSLQPGIEAGHQGLHALTGSSYIDASSSTVVQNGLCLRNSPEYITEEEVSSGEGLSLVNSNPDSKCEPLAKSDCPNLDTDSSIEPPSLSGVSCYDPAVKSSQDIRTNYENQYSPLSARTHKQFLPDFIVTQRAQQYAVSIVAKEAISQDETMPLQYSVHTYDESTKEQNWRSLPIQEMSEPITDSPQIASCDSESEISGTAQVHRFSFDREELVRSSDAQTTSTCKVDVYAPSKHVETTFVQTNVFGCTTSVSPTTRFSGDADEFDFPHTPPRRLSSMPVTPEDVPYASSSPIKVVSSSPFGKSFRATLASSSLPSSPLKSPPSGTPLSLNQACRDLAKESPAKGYRLQSPTHLPVEDDETVDQNQLKDTGSSDDAVKIRQPQAKSGARSASERGSDDATTSSPPAKRLRASPTRPPGTWRPTISAHRIQHKKLAKPFRSPVINTTTSMPLSDASSPSGPTLPDESSRASTPQTNVHEASTASSPATAQLSTPKKDYTPNAAKQFKSPFATESSSSPIANRHSQARLTPAIQGLERQVQLLRRAVKIKNDHEAGKVDLEQLARKWRTIARDVAWEVWAFVKDNPEQSRDRGGWGYGGEDAKPPFDEQSKSWGWDGAVGEDSDRQHIEREKGEGEEDENDIETPRQTLEAMLRQLRIDPATLGWNKDVEDFFDD